LAASLRIRAAQRGEASLLSALCVRSKAHWGYDAEFMRLSWRSLQIDPTAIEEGRVFVAVDQRDRPLGVVDCAFLGEDVDLMHLFVEPTALGRGVGRALFSTAIEWTRAQSRRTLLIASDPNAVGFYRRLGAVDADSFPIVGVLDVGRNGGGIRVVKRRAVADDRDVGSPWQPDVEHRRPGS